MALKVSHPLKEKGNTVPYPPLFDDIRRNHGFLDLRARPDLVSQIPEALESPALRQLLVKLADPSSQIMTLGCDLGEHTERSQPLNRRRCAGGYVQIAPLPLGPTDKDRLLSIARAAEAQLSQDVGNAFWEVEFALTLTAFSFNERLETHTMWIWFLAKAYSAEKARRAREALLLSLAAGLG
jgi:hypothetical protein